MLSQLDCGGHRLTSAAQLLTTAIGADVISPTMLVASALAAGLGISGLACLISVVDSDSFLISVAVAFMVLSVGSYSRVAVLLCRWWKGQFKQVLERQLVSFARRRKRMRRIERNGRQWKLFLA